ncbi:MAG: hypothetical protein CMJ34_11920 [Phycisphaerae bacterium]|nr:hypothetical protein [Phycisphaerae bacterium]
MGGAGSTLADPDREIYQNPIRRSIPRPSRFIGFPREDVIEKVRSHGKKAFDGSIRAFRRGFRVP